MVSHMNLREYFNIKRNISNEQALKISRNGGVLGQILFKGYLRKAGKKVGIKEVADSIDRLVQIAGIDCVSIGTDMDAPIDLPKGLSTPRHYPRLTEELMRRSYSEADLKKLWSGNFFRVWKEVEKLSSH